ncbi:hypothetical protein ACHAQJ_005133 [Trichoderma viride]
MNAASLDPYKILGVPDDAQIYEIRRSYRKLVLKCHPDKVHDPGLKAQKQDEFQKLQIAYEILSDEGQRQKYDSLKLTQKILASRGTNSNGNAHYKPSRVYEYEKVPPGQSRSGSAGGVSSSRPGSYQRWSSDDGSGRRTSAAAYNSRPASPTSPAFASSSREIPRRGSGSRWNYFRRSPASSQPRRNGSQSSRGSQMSADSVGSQVSWEELDKYDYVLREMDKLASKHIKRLQTRRWGRPKPPKLLANRCIHNLSSFQNSIGECIGADHGQSQDANYGQFLQSASDYSSHVSKNVTAIQIPVTTRSLTCSTSLD